VLNNTTASGFLLVHKPSGITSFDVIHKLRRILGIKKLGHSGVLDRPASGLLVVGANKATRLFELFGDFQKDYEADVWLGVSTSTDDLTGELLSTTDPTKVTREQFEAALLKYRGQFAQVPPAFSLAKKAGREAYRYALAGEAVQIEARQVTVHDSALLAFEPKVPAALALSEPDTAAVEGKLAESASQLPPLTRARIRLTCAGGLYVRSLARDIGADLGCGAAMGRLLRRRVGPYELADARTLEQLEQLMAAGTEAAELLRPMSSVATDEQSLQLDAEQVRLLKLGQTIRTTAVKLPANAEAPIYGLDDSTNALVALLKRGEPQPGGLIELRPVKVFA
jgi:tRNA pseudouridine55 synthase